VHAGPEVERALVGDEQLAALVPEGQVEAEPVRFAVVNADHRRIAEEHAIARHLDLLSQRQHSGGVA
jgi:hypothetical protein